MKDLIPSLAFTALLEMHPTYPRLDVTSESAKSLLRDLTQGMHEALDRQDPDLWMYAKSWINNRVAPHLDRDGYGCLTAGDTDFPPLEDRLPGPEHLCVCGQRWQIREVAGFVVWAKIEGEWLRR
jgi:hypothetical protein